MFTQLGFFIVAEKMYFSMGIYYGHRTQTDTDCVHWTIVWKQNSYILYTIRAAPFVLYTRMLEQCMVALVNEDSEVRIGIWV